MDVGLHGVRELDAVLRILRDLAEEAQHVKLAPGSQRQGLTLHDIACIGVGDGSVVDMFQYLVGLSHDIDEPAVDSLDSGLALRGGVHVVIEIIILGT